MLFYRFDKNLPEFKGIWKYDSKNQKIVLAKEHRGIFSLSNFVINILDNCSVVKEFINELPYIICKGKKNDDLIVKEVNKCSIMSEIKAGGKDILPLQKFPDFSSPHSSSVILTARTRTHL